MQKLYRFRIATFYLGVFGVFLFILLKGSFVYLTLIGFPLIYLLLLISEYAYLQKQLKRETLKIYSSTPKQQVWWKVILSGITGILFSLILIYFFPDNFYPKFLLIITPVYLFRSFNYQLNWQIIGINHSFYLKTRKLEFIKLPANVHLREITTTKIELVNDNYTYEVELTNPAIQQMKADLNGKST